MSSHAKSVLLSMMVGGTLRLYGLGSESLSLAEASTFRRVGLSYKDLFFDTGNASQLPLYFWITKAWCALAGTGEIALRTPALIFGLLLIPAVFFLGREMVNAKAGAWGAFLVAINPYLIFYSQEARHYSIFALLSVCSSGFLLQWMNSRTKTALFLFVASTAGTLYSHPFGVLILPANLAAFLLYSPRSKGDGRLSLFPGFWRATELCGLLYLPLLYRMAREFESKLAGGSVAAWIPEPGWTAIFETLSRYFMSSMLLITALALVLILPLLRPGGRQRTRLYCTYTGLAFFIYLVIPFVLSETITPLFYHRYTIPFLPLLLLLLGLTMSRLAPTPRRIALVLLLGLTTPPVFDYHTKVDKAPVKEAFGSLVSRLSPGDLVITDPGWIVQLSDYYLPLPEGVTQLSPYSIDDVQRALGARDVIWVVTEGEGSVGAEEMFETGTLPDWTLYSREFLDDDIVRNPRSFSFQKIKISRFVRGIVDAQRGPLENHPEVSNP